MARIVTDSDPVRRGRELLARPGPLVVVSGAGMSAGSGIPTFRDAEDGLWSRYDPMDMATVAAWERGPDLVWGWYRGRQFSCAQAEPNAGHRAIAAAQTSRPVAVVTQNVDDLHERAGSHTVHHLHGSLFAHRCSRCDRPVAVPLAESVPDGPQPPPVCPDCAALVRPAVVWFGEMLPTEPWEAAEFAIAQAAVLLVVGTSGLVYPAAALPQMAAESGIPIIEVNPGDSGLGSVVDLHIRQPAEVALPLLLPVDLDDTPLPST